MNADDLAFTLNSLAASAKSTEARIAEVSKLVDTLREASSQAIAEQRAAATAERIAFGKATAKLVADAEARLFASHVAARTALDEFTAAREELAAGASKRIGKAYGGFEKAARDIREELASTLAEVRRQRWIDYGRFSLKLAGWLLLAVTALAVVVALFRWIAMPAQIITYTRTAQYVCTGKPNRTASNCKLWATIKDPNDPRTP